MKKVKGQSLNIEQFINEPTYQDRLLDIAEDLAPADQPVPSVVSDVEATELIMLSLIIRSRLGRLGQVQVPEPKSSGWFNSNKTSSSLKAVNTPIKEAAAKKDDKPKEDDQYIFGLR